MFQFNPRDEGYLVVNAEQRTVADVTTNELVLDGRAVPQKRALPREQWRIHFCGRRFAPAELEAFVQQLALLEASCRA